LRRAKSTEELMAFIFRSIAVIGIIALNSPVHGDKAWQSDLVEKAGNGARAAAHIDRRHAAQTLTAAREAAELIAGLDPETRKHLTTRIIEAASAGAAKSP